MNLVQRYKKPTPKFFKTLRNIGIALATAGGAIIAAPIALPAAVVTVATYMTVAGTVATAVSQAVVSDDSASAKAKKEKSEDIGKTDSRLSRNEK
ncbi:hypothetical protein EAX61_06870 [Dokdonia sinensis]|jgi:hypothetical protein|uniref:Uncharacterized protein n=1 Tax=Dokdonia sinensis TaxID=2479847 RepID=A0A3M0G7S8_9FLAO|nr:MULTISPECIES: hypothetical protein [Flavobacteriaceae]RMB60538.1 hypothetical protein EAX61_06870 [Dokdonia sinensis]